MKYRRFGKTELQMPVLTCGGMRFQQSWQDLEKNGLDQEKQANLAATVRYAVANGINHIETARGYGSSEYQLGLVLPALPRDEIIVQTKIGPKDSEGEFLDAFETSLKHLQLEYVDLLGVHGINNPDVLKKTLKKGTLKACRKLQDQGLVRHVGFSTHDVCDGSLEAVKTGEFAYINLHWYYFDQRNWPVIEEASNRDMGVFIISPSDKGGKLYDPPAKLVDLCRPLTPMGFNDLFCLSHPQVHTISIGAARPEDFDVHLAGVPALDRVDEIITPVLKKLQDQLIGCMGEDWALHWHEGLPTIIRAPEEIPVYHVVRMYNMAKAYGMVEYGKMRYNLLGSGGHWFPGQKPEGVDPRKIERALDGYRFADRIPGILKEAHEIFNAEPKKRLSES